MVITLTEADHVRVSAAIAEAEAASDGEIVAVVTPASDSYHDVALHWAVAALILVLAWAAWRPDWLTWWYDLLLGGWRAEPTLGQLLTFLMVLAVLKFTAVLLLLKYRPLRLMLTPGATKQRRVRRRAIGVFKAAAERRTIGRTGVLIYLSIAERRAEIVADEAIIKVTDDKVWGQAMAALVTHVRDGRPGDGLCAAIGQVGAVLAGHFPRTSGDSNEIPDKLIIL
jgi:putative membrane protein